MLFRGYVLVVFGSVLVQATHNPALDTAWEDWKLTHQKQYLSLGEEDIRRTIWEKNMQMIEAHNQEYELGIHTYELGMNHLGDMTKEEVVDDTVGFRPDMHVELNNTFVPESNPGPVPPCFDYRKMGYVTAVKDQGKRCRQCGWAFSAAGALEGQLKKKGKKLIDLSAQNLVDCVKKPSISSAFKITYAYMYVRDNGIASEKDYPYNGEKGSRCDYNHCRKAATCKDFWVIQPGEESILTNFLVQFGPISVGFDASQHTFRFYKKGTYVDYYCQPDQSNHALLIVGYTSRAWIVKNSWGKKWGDDGYIYIERGRNVCGIASMASYPTV